MITCPAKTSLKEEARGIRSSFQIRRFFFLSEKLPVRKCYCMPLLMPYSALFGIKTLLALLKKTSRF